MPEYRKENCEQQCLGHEAVAAHETRSGWGCLSKIKLDMVLAWREEGR